jgi:hypothetical protein
MQTILAILRAAHCRSTHHYFAIDALREVLTPEGTRLAQMLLANFSGYLQGAKDPDTVFKDFENHVVHVSDGYWGGAAKTGEKWLAQTYQQLKGKQWKEAAYSIGVLSHYFSDPWMPLHTGQTPRETTFHRPLEWSVCCAYQEILDQCIANTSFESFQLPTGERWLTDSIHAGATLSHRYYESIMNDYDMRESGKQPALALGKRSKEELAQIFTWVLTAWGAAIDRIAESCQCSIPEFSLTMPTLMATIQVPAKKIVSAIKNAEQRKEIEKVLDEFHRTGQVVKNVAEEQRTVAKIRQSKPTLAPAATEVQRAQTLPQVVQATKPVSRPKAIQPTPQRAAAIPPQPIANIAPPPRAEVQPAKQPRSMPVPLATPPEARSAELTQEQVHEKIGPWSPIVDAPAIGPKTAERLKSININTIGDLLHSNPADVARSLATSWINEKTIATWIVQARLVCEIERLTAVGSGLLALSGIETAAAMIHRGESDVHRAILVAAETSEGKRMLRDKEPPGLERVQRWFKAARKSAEGRSNTDRNVA